MFYCGGLAGVASSNADRGGGRVVATRFSSGSVGALGGGGASALFKT